MYIEPPWPLDELARLGKLKSYGMLDTPDEELFDRITKLAARHFGMPIALVTLVDETRQWFKSRYGLAATCTSRRLAFCAYTILEQRVMVVPDATGDERFAHNELVTGPPHLRFYAGAPLVTPEGFLLGTLCVLDYRPRPDFGPERQRDLADFARLVMHEFEARVSMAAVEEAKGEAQRASDSKTRFLAAASHDLRQPIQAAALYTGLIGDRITDPETRELLGRLQASIDGLNALLAGLLDLSRLEAGAIEPMLTDFVPDILLARLAAEFRAQAELKGIALRNRSCRQPVHSDPHLLERMLRNLLSNAVTYTLKGGILVACRRRGRDAEFQVWDTGPGIADQHRSAIFEEFHQLDTPQREAGQGFGLGLAIVSRIARLLGLNVDVQSRPGRGSVFSIRVPLSAAAARVEGPPVAAGSAGPAAGTTTRFPGRTVLVVEDNEPVRSALELLLESWGMNALSARSCDELDELLMGLIEAPDALITDHRLPDDCTGRDAVELVRRRWDVPAIVITGDTAAERSDEALSAGCRLLHKPVVRTELAMALDELLAGRRHRLPPTPDRQN